MATMDLITRQSNLPTTPEIPGLILRGFRGEADYPNILAIINASKVADQIERSDTLEDIARNYAHLHHCDPYQDMVFAEVNGETVGYSRVWWDLNAEGEWLGMQVAFLQPAWRCQGIGTAMLRHTERRLRQIADRLLAEGIITPQTRCYLDAFAMDSEAGAHALLQREGYTPVRYEFSMLRPLSEPVEVTPMPDGLEVRPVRPEDIRAVWDASQEAFRDHWNPILEPEEELHKILEDPDFDLSLWQVGCDGDQVAGSVLNFFDSEENQEYNRKRGYTEGISVRRPWRKRGLARALLTRSLKMFQDMGMDEAALGVDAENLSGALRLYESVGFRVVKRQTIYRKAL